MFWFKVLTKRHSEDTPRYDGKEEEKDTEWGKKHIDQEEREKSSKWDYPVDNKRQSWALLLRATA